jgi:hypothetical protein
MGCLLVPGVVSWGTRKGLSSVSLRLSGWVQLLRARDI